MFYRSLSVIAFLIFSISCYSQQRDTSSVIQGIVIDSSSSIAISYSKIELHKIGSKETISSTFSNEKGFFSITSSSENSQFLLIKTIGYKDKVIELRPTLLNIGVIKLETISRNLKEVVVHGTKPIIENKIDRLVFNPDIATIQNSVTIADVLQKTPLVSTGQNDQLFVRGKPNVKIYLNDRPVSQDVIKGLPANSISSIEIITNPSAKYDAEGYTIINVITKKKKLDGYEGIISAGGGVYDRYNGLFNLGIKESKLSVNLNYSFNNLTNSGTTTNKIERTSGLQTQDGTINNRQKFQFGNIGIDYDIDTLNKIGGAVNIYQYVFHKTFQSKFADTNPLDSIGNYNLSSYDLVKRSGGYGEINYNHIFKNTNSSINFAILFNELKIKDNLVQDQTFFPGDQFTMNNNFDSEVFKETTYQIDYNKKFRNKSKLEIGTKLIVRDNTSNYSNGTDSIKNNLLNTFQYKQSIFALYGVYNFSIGKLDAQLGLREEATSLNSFLLNGSNATSQPNYSNLFPNANLLYNFTNNEQLKLSYSERIQRPGIFYLNPYSNPLDPRDVSSGNPQLNPETIDQLQLDYSKTIGKSYIDGSISYMHNNNAISSYTSSLSDITLLSTYENVNQAHSFSGDVYFSTIPFKKDNFNISFGAEDYFINDTHTSNSGWNYYGTFRDSYSFKNNMSLSVSINYISQQINLQGKDPGSLSNNIGISKYFLNRKLLIAFSTDDPFRLGGVYKSYTQGPNFVQNLDNKINLQTFQFRIAYFFGKRSSTKAHEVKVKNSDLKNGGL
jgi:hypothetical protein